ncbi:hypothetical protein T310_0961 [Rasamsonia emersonii CBS 393.64]|uniref:Uncharacterized protein n=1 Tax=Rasamsonia emersonii (strain ATCC 16479 / CBS 393.64 / IMI 116815) TaxID=1408163 RepID=A0A0F4Z3Q0_RASE3|nr:hypothetical protein T310_0961 [Rasamsonia emersonii CBS 393.64]KKA24980.1 hypothetical protein T310_0961 [Rasamsonia emersonii CBS 393.64]
MDAVRASSGRCRSAEQRGGAICLTRAASSPDSALEQVTCTLDAGWARANQRQGGFLEPHCNLRTATIDELEECTHSGSCLIGRSMLALSCFCVPPSRQARTECSLNAGAPLAKSSSRWPNGPGRGWAAAGHSGLLIGAASHDSRLDSPRNGHPAGLLAFVLGSPAFPAALKQASSCDPIFRVWRPPLGSAVVPALCQPGSPAKGRQSTPESGVPRSRLAGWQPSPCAHADGKFMATQVTQPFPLTDPLVPNNPLFFFSLFALLHLASTLPSPPFLG